MSLRVKLTIKLLRFFKKNESIKRFIEKNKDKLAGADLSNLNLDHVYLDGARLDGANLSGSSFYDASLSEACLSGANLTKTNFQSAVLKRANLTFARFNHTNLKFADLISANLNATDISNSDFKGADLTGASSVYAKLPDSIVPEGEIIGYKKLRDGTICKLKIPAHAERINGINGRKCRASEAVVLEGHGYSFMDVMFYYSEGAIVKPKYNFDPCALKSCASGIHFFLTKEEAEKYIF